MGLKYINQNGEEVIIAGKGLNGKDGGVVEGTIVYIEDNAKVPEGWDVVEGDNALPIGSGMDYYGATAPKGYMFADGSAISRTEYAELFKIFGTTYGAGNGSTTFNLPDKREAVAIMKGNTYKTLGAIAGANTKTIAKTNLPKTKLKVTYQDTYPIVSNSDAVGTFNKNDRTLNFNTGTTTPSTSELRTEFLGDGTAFNVMQKSLVCNYIIKVKSLKAIKKVSATPIDEKTGLIYDTTNIDDKSTNTYSANTIDGLLQLGSQGWQSAGINTDMYSSGRVRYMQIGKLVIVDFSDLLLKGNPTGDVVLVYGLPPASELEIFTISGTNGGNVKTNHRLYLNEQGNVGNWYDTQDISTSMYYYGQLIYLAK